MRTSNVAGRTIYVFGYNQNQFHHVTSYFCKDDKYIWVRNEEVLFGIQPDFSYILLEGWMRNEQYDDRFFCRLQYLLQRAAESSRPEVKWPLQKTSINEFINSLKLKPAKAILIVEKKRAKLKKKPVKKFMWGNRG